MPINMLTRIFCDVYEFIKNVYIPYCGSSLIADEADRRKLLPECRMSLSEIMTIVILFHLSGYRCFIWYYSNCIRKTYHDCFPKALSYNRFIELMPSVFVALLLYTMKFRIGKCSGISFVDSTTIKICRDRRIYSHKVFDGLAATGKGSMGWFYGFKLHLVINDRGEILSFCATPGNTDDMDIGVIDKLCQSLYGKLFADRGYISQKLFERLLSKGVTLVTRLKRNMKNKLLPSATRFCCERGLLLSL